jgi:hypothetical protein
MIFLYFFYLYFAKIYGPTKILQKYTSAAVGHGGRDSTAVRNGGRSLPPGECGLQVAPQATTVGMDLLPCAAAVGIFLGKFQILKH